ncbi:metal ABC transporter ATP-binding protein [Paenibacillus psychroresistens]|uniref:Metal ABC transporter ATP-binding protein n=1 Tax=Paenibacillus psychroresistens TaxID=1778678 RepID=A0A6B8RJH3_9BACL|nr:metal ABC transporter ATP-binding protein [Paenibacillus psychroresistens]QGQ96410.1 metal ABC transporter ATP-binding protein [Paenibacillus psychroresistens]
MGCEILVQDVTVHLGNKCILDRVTFTVKPGEFLGIIGPNGAGKTTLFQVLLGILEPQHGRILFEDDLHKQLAGSSVIGYVPQARQMDPEVPMTSWDFVSLGLPHKIRPWFTSKDRTAIKEALRLTDAESLSDKMIGKLSGGERQRVYLAQALVRNPQILLLDEPTSNLDPGAQEKMAAVVARICNETGTSVLFISHDVNLIARYAHRILYLTKGHYAVGTVEEVMQSDVLSNLYGNTVEVMKKGTKLMLVSDADDAVSSICHHNS